MLNNCHKYIEKQQVGTEEFSLDVSLKRLAQVLCVCSCALSATAGAVIVEVAGDTVIFRWDTDLIDPKYGTPTVAGDSIFVTPTGFSALSENIDGAVTSFGAGTVQIIAKAGYNLDGINFGETGDYRMTGDSVSVDVDPYLRVFDWFDAVPVIGTEETQHVTVTGDLTINDGNLHDWSAAGGFDLTTGTWDGVNHVGLTLQNTLNATSLILGDSALIQKKAIGASIDVSTSPIPVPAALWLFGSGLLGLVGVARRKKT